MLLFEGTLTLDGGQPIPARLELAIDRLELAALLAGPSGDSAARQWSIAAEPATPPAIPPRVGSAKGGAFEPIEIRDHPGRRIKFEHLAMISDPAKIWAALAERFPWANFKVPTGTPEITAGDLAGDPIESDEAITRPDSDWLTIEPHLSELVDDEGRLAKGYQSRIAELLGGENAGAFRRSRVMPLVELLKRWVDEEWVYSSSTTPDEDQDESDETGESARVA